MIKLIIFDFDGVLADSFEQFYSLIKESMRRAGLNLTRVQYRNFFIENVHKSFKGFIDNDKKYEIFMKFRNYKYDQYYSDKTSGVKLFPEAPSFINKLNGKYMLAIASSGKERSLKKLLQKNTLKNRFSLILAGTADSKEEMLKKIISKLKVKNKETVMITDTAGDVKTAKKLGLKTIAVIWGFHSAKTLKTAKPSYIANNFKILYKTLKAF